MQLPRSKWTLEKSSQLTSNSNLKYRELKLKSVSEFIDIIYVLLVTINDDLIDSNDLNQFIKIGTTMVDRLETRLVEWRNDFGKEQTIQLLGIYEIPHSKVERKFHSWMNKNHSNIIIDVTINDKTKKECYLDSITVIELLEYFLKSNN